MTFTDTQMDLLLPRGRDRQDGNGIITNDATRRSPAC